MRSNNILENSLNFLGAQALPDISQLLDTLLCRAESGYFQAMHGANCDCAAF